MKQKKTFAPKKPFITGRSRIVLLILLSFLFMICLGTILLWCPLTSGQEGFTFIEALFTATSAVCVTGLSPVANISEHLNIFGDIVMMILIEVGGLGLVTIIMFIMLMFGFKVTHTQQLLMKEVLNQDSLNGIKKLLVQIMITALAVQVIGAFLLFFDLFFYHHYTLLQSIGYAIFHSVSAFCNAGFDLFGDSSLIAFQNDYFFVIVISLIIIVGGIGFVVIFDILDKMSFKKLNVHSKIVLLSTVVLIFGGMLLIKISSWNSMTWLQAYFTSVTCRTAGFTIADLSNISHGTSLIMMILMFIGASPASTGGGVKVTTIFTVFSSFRAFAEGREETHAFKRKLSENLIYKAFTLMTFALCLIFLSFFIISVIEPGEYTTQQLMFETVSAFSTAGLSMGITSSLSDISKVLLCFVMYIGRLGPITFVSLFNRNISSYSKDNVRYVEENIIIG